MEFIVRRVEDGETLQDIAAETGVPAAVILEDNAFKEENVFAGTRLLIRKNPGKIYYAEPFDTLNSVAEKHGIDPRKISEFNDGIEEIFFGQILFLPEDSEGERKGGVT
ncbi:MAG: LysM peptidoglycan-binding domain-containing protein [Clostridiales bacterium]|jgi:LysM repeat protein|nr:LysM peptidoglycan-binding domain-containing protein [Clostridiales bacterium]